MKFVKVALKKCVDVRGSHVQISIPAKMKRDLSCML